MNVIQKSMDLRFCLTLRIIADVLERSRIKIIYCGSRDTGSLTNVRLYHPGSRYSAETLYVGHASEMAKDPGILKKAAVVMAGGEALLPEGRKAPAVIVPEDTDIFELFDQIQDTFQLYRKWNWEIEKAVNSSCPLDDILRSSMKVLRNPMFIHDNNFYILSDPCHTEGMSEYEKDPKTGKDMISAELINDFRTEKSYLKGLSEHRALIFPSDRLGYHSYQILFRNLWLRGQYVGRVLVDAIYSPIQPGDFYVLDYIGNVLEYYMSERRLISLSFENDVDAFFEEFITGRNADERYAEHFLEYMLWNRDDRYICLRIINEQRESGLMSSSSILNQIDNQIGSGHSFYHSNGIVAVVNLTYDNVAAADVMKNLAIVMRDNLLKVGISSEVRDFMLIPKAYRQAQIALDLGHTRENTNWYYYFEQYMLEYIVDCAVKEMPVPMLRAAALEKLKRYDAENNTDLFQTLKIYLNNEENVLQAAKKLYIHRSTLSYRLKKIQSIINEDLTDVHVRLKLMLSYFIDGEHLR